MKKILFILFTIIVSNSFIFCKDKISNDTTYWNRIISNKTEHSVFLFLKIKTTDYDGEVLIDQNRLFFLYLKEVLPYNKDKTIKNYRRDIFDLLINKKSLLLNNRLDSLTKYKVVAINDSISIKYRDYKIEEILNKYFEEVHEHLYRYKFTFDNISDYYALIYYLISKRFIVFADCSSGILTVIDVLKE
jgi:hypothetical protein